jgi:hypothetical protein
MKPEDIRAYVDRDWQAVADAKIAYWAERKRLGSPAESLQIGDALLDWVKTLHPDWPTEEDRVRDLDTHLRVSRALQSVAAAKSR